MATVDEVLAGARKTCGDVITLGVQKYDVERVTTGVFAFDLATGGFPRGRISVLYGKESSSKTTMALKAIATMQRTHPELQNVFIDVEASYSPEWGEILGVDNSSLVYALPEYAEQAVDLVDAFMQAEDVGIIVVDSLAALATQTELQESADKQTMGGRGSVVNKLCRKAVNAIGQARADGRFPTLILINQVRDAIGVMYGSTEVMPGGKSVLFASSLTVRMYGKDEMDKGASLNLPAWKVISEMVKKWKVPIVASVFEARIASIPNPELDLMPGQSNDWPTVFGYLKQFEMLAKGEKKGWSLLGETYDTQAQIKERFQTEAEYAEQVKAAVIKTAFAAAGVAVGTSDGQ